MNMKQLVPLSVARLKDASPTILAILGTVGVILTAVSAVKATTKAQKSIRKEQDRLEDVCILSLAVEPEPLTKMDIVKVTWTHYIPTAVIAISTMACILGSNALNKHKQAVITSAYMFIDNAFKEYKAKTKELYGEEAEQKIKEEVVKKRYEFEGCPLTGDVMLFYEEYYDEYFCRTREEVLNAECALNKSFSEEGFANLNTFYTLLGLENKSVGDFLGWSYEVGNLIYGYSWIEFDHKLITMNDGMECTIIGFPGSTPTNDYLSSVASSDELEHHGRYGRF